MFALEPGDAGLCCRSCGLDYAGGLDCCPQCGTRSGARQSPQPEFRPLRVLAVLLIVALAFVTVMVAARVAIRELGLEADTWDRGYAVMQIDKITDVTAFGLGVVFVMWFYCARANAEHRGWAQRRARAWTFWGWVLPIASLFVPFQLMGDIWRAGLPAGRRGKTAWLPALWWASFLLSEAASSPRETNTEHYSLPHLSGDTSTFGMCMLAVAGLALIAIIRLVSYGPVGTPHADRLPASPAPSAA
jgi:Domain of unknown function (DUF4328)